MFIHIVLVAAVLFTLLYVRFARGIVYEGGVPRLGKPGVFGYIRTALRWAVDAEGLIIEGRKQFNNGPFVIPLLWGQLFYLPPKYLDRVRSSPDSIFDQVAAINDELQLKYTMDEFQLDTPYQSKVMRTDANRAIPTFVPVLQEESAIVISEALKPSYGQDSVSLSVFHTMTYIVGSITNCVMLGKELSRNKDFIHAVVTFAESVTIVATPLRWIPVFLRPYLYYLLSFAVGGKKGALKYVMPHLKSYMKRRSNLPVDGEPVLIMEHLLRAVPPDEPIEIIANRILNLNFGSIHTSSIFSTQALLELALLSKEDIEGIRSEIVEAVESEGGWTKGALDKFYKLDSALREVGRFHGLMQHALPRVAVVGCELEDGQYVPPGYRVAIDMKVIHFDPEIYPDPYRCDLFRFSKLRSTSGDPSNSKYAFSTVDSTYLPFGIGRHACAGRWFASMVLKLMLAHILLEYDVTYPPGITTRPKNIVFNGTVIPDPKAHLVFKRRANKVD